MAGYWSSFSTNVMTTAADFATDMLPIMAVVGGIAIGASVVMFAIRAMRG